MSRDRKGRFLTGGKPGPGRPSGSRNRLAEDFLADVCADWKRNGAAVLANVRTNNPGGYFRVVASLIPRDVIVQTAPSEFESLTDAQLLETMKEQMRLFSLTLGRGSEED